MESKKTFGEYIRERRRAMGLTQREFAEKLYVTESAVSKWERGMSYPDVTLLRRQSATRRPQRQLHSVPCRSEGRRMAWRSSSRRSSVRRLARRGGSLFPSPAAKLRKSVMPTPLSASV